MLYRLVYCISVNKTDDLHHNIYRLLVCRFPTQLQAPSFQSTTLNTQL